VQLETENAESKRRVKKQNATLGKDAGFKSECEWMPGEGIRCFLRQIIVLFACLIARFRVSRLCVL